MLGNRWAVPVGSFVLAVILASVAGPIARVGAFRAPAQQTGGCKCKLDVMKVTSQVGWTRGPANRVLTAFTINEGADVCSSGDPTDQVTVRAFVKREVTWTAVCTPNNPGPPPINDANKKQKMNLELGPGPDIFTPPCEPGVHTCPGWTDNLAGLTATAKATLEASLNAKHPGYTCVVTIVGIFQDDNSVHSFVNAKITCDGSDDCRMDLLLYPAARKPPPNMGNINGNHVCKKECK